MSVVLFTLAFVFVLLTTVAAQVPSQVHVGYGTNSSEYVISWVNIETNGTRSSYVEFGYSPDALTNIGEGVPVVFTEDRCKTERIMHDVVLYPIKVGMRVYYRVSSGPGTPVSPIFNFYTIDREDLSPSRPLVATLVGDMTVVGLCNISSVGMMANYSATDSHDLVVHYGDIAYNLDDNCNVVGDTFMDGVQSVAAYTPYVFGVGNHETDKFYSYHSFLSRYAGQHNMAAASGSKSVRYFSFDVQLVHFVVFDTDAWVYPLVFPLAHPQIEWMKQDLASVDRSRTPWIVVFGHRAMYCTKDTDNECNSEAEHIRNGYPIISSGVEPLLLEYGADLYVAGHTHHYMRTWPVKKDVATQLNYVNPGGPIHVQGGISGVDGNDPFSLPMRPIDAWRDENYTVSFSTITVHNASHMTFTQRRAVDGSVLDEFVIVQDRHGPF